MIETIILSLPVLYVGFIISSWIFPGPSKYYDWSISVRNWLGIEQAWSIPPERKWLVIKAKFLTGLIDLSIFIFRCLLALLLVVTLMFCVSYIADFLGTTEEILRWKEEVDDNDLEYR